MDLVTKITDNKYFADLIKTTGKIPRAGEKLYSFEMHIGQRPNTVLRTYNCVHKELGATTLETRTCSRSRVLVGGQQYNEAHSTK